MIASRVHQESTKGKAQRQYSTFGVLPQSFQEPFSSFGRCKPTGQRLSNAKSISPRQNPLMRLAFVQRGPFWPPFVAVDEAHVVEAEKVQDGGVQVVDVEAVLDGVQAHCIRHADGLSRRGRGPLT